MNPGAASSGPAGITAVGSTLYFSAYDDVSGQELWKSDGTAAGTVLVKDINPTAGFGGNVSYPTAINGTLYFLANDGTSGNELWKSNGTTAGTVRVFDLNAGAGDGLGKIFP
jgi:ELWxxDGT repeat protein